MKIKKAKKSKQFFFSALSNKTFCFCFFSIFKKKISFFYIYKKWQQNIIKKPKKCYKEKLMKTIEIFSGEKKCKYAHNQCRKLFIENELIEEEKNRKCQHAWSLYNNLSEKTGKRNEYAREKNGNLSEVEKYKKGQYAC